MSKICNKDYKFFKYNTDGIFTTGRIKRMRKGRESRYVNLKKRLGKMVTSFSGIDFYYPIQRWTRH